MRRSVSGLSIIEGLARLTNARFQVANLQMAVIAKQLNRAAISKVLQGLSSQTHVYYGQALARIEANLDFGAAIMRMIGWMLTLREPLSMEELSQALGIDHEMDESTSPQDLEVHIQSLLAMSEGLIESYPSATSPLAFTHETVRCYLHARLAEDNVDWNAGIARSYLRYMSLDWCVGAFYECCRTFIDYPASPSSPSTWYSLLLKAAKTWTTYARAAHEDTFASEQSLVDRFVREQGGLLLILCCIYDWPSIARKVVESTRISPCTTYMSLYSPLHVAIGLGRYHVTRALGDSAHTRINDMGFSQTLSERPPIRPCCAGTFGPNQTRWVQSEPAPDELLRCFCRWGVACVLREVPTADARTETRPEPPQQYARTDPMIAEQSWAHGSDERSHEGPFTDRYVLQHLGLRPLFLAVDGPRHRLDVSSLRDDAQWSRQTHDKDILQILLDRRDVDINAVGFAGFTAVLVAVHNVNVEAVQLLLRREDLNVNHVTFSGPPLVYLIHRLRFKHERDELSRRWDHQTGSEAAIARHHASLAILEAFLTRRDINVNTRDELGHTALDWLLFYQMLSANEEVNIFIDGLATAESRSARERRDGVAPSQAEFMRRVVDFNRTCRWSLDDIVALLTERGAQPHKSVTARGWWKWIWPPAEHLNDDGSRVVPQRAQPGQRTGLREREGNAHSLTYHRIPFAEF